MAQEGAARSGVPTRQSGLGRRLPCGRPLGECQALYGAGLDEACNEHMVRRVAFPEDERVGGSLVDQVALIPERQLRNLAGLWILAALGNQD